MVELTLLMKILLLIGYVIVMAITAGMIGGINDRSVTFDFLRILFWPITLILWAAYLFLFFWYKVGGWIRNMVVKE